MHDCMGGTRYNLHARNREECERDVFIDLQSSPSVIPYRLEPCKEIELVRQFDEEKCSLIVLEKFCLKKFTLRSFLRK